MIERKERENEENKEREEERGREEKRTKRERKRERENSLRQNQGVIRHSQWPANAKNEITTIFQE